MLHFCTLFDKNYLPHGLALWESLHRFRGDDFQLYILCLDKYTLNFFNGNEKYIGVIPVDLCSVEMSDPQILNAKSNRSKIEYYFTLSACFPLYLLLKYPHLPMLCSIDADVFFFSDPLPLFEKFEKHSIVITPHKFTDELKATGVEKFGRYNVSFQVFRRNEVGIRCLELWRTKCIEWCYDRYDETTNRFADQKYLDTWMDDFKGEVMELNDAATGLAPWNLNNYPITFENGQLLSAGEPLIFYHFHGLKAITERWYANAFYYYRTKGNNTIKRHIYLPYIKILNKWRVRLNLELDYDARYGSRSASKWTRLINAVSLYFLAGNNDLRSINFLSLNKVYSFWQKKLRLRYGTVNEAPDV